MSALKDQVAPKIRATLVSDEDRPNFLPSRLGQYFLKFEAHLYDLASSQSNYNGGYWEFYTLDNGGWYLAPKHATGFDVQCPNYHRGHMSADAFGVAFSLLAINHLLWYAHEKDPECAKQLHTAFYALRDFAADHKEGAEIFGVID